jgi:hypothetical protein
VCKIFPAGGFVPPKLRLGENRRWPSTLATSTNAFIILILHHIFRDELDLPKLRQRAMHARRPLDKG